MEKNRDDIQLLAQRLVDIIIIIHDDVITRGNTAASGYKAMCLEFVSCLGGILEELNKVKRKNKNRLKQYFKVDHISDVIKRFEVQVDDLRRNFESITAVDTRFEVSMVNANVMALREDVQSLQAEVMTVVSPALTVPRDDLSAFRQDFRPFKYGDLELIREVARLDKWVLRRVSGKKNEVARVYTNGFTDYSARIGFETNPKYVRVFEGPEARKNFCRELRFFADIRRGGQLSGLRPSKGRPTSGRLGVAQLFGFSDSESMCPALIFHGDLRTVDDYMGSAPAMTCVKYENRWWTELQDAVVYLSRCLPGIGFIDPFGVPLMITSEGRICITHIPSVLDDTPIYGIKETPSLSLWRTYPPELLHDLIGPHHHDIAYTTIEPQVSRRGISELLTTFHDMIGDLGRTELYVVDDEESLAFQSGICSVRLGNADSPLFQLPRCIYSITEGHVHTLFGPPDHYPWESFQVSHDLIRFTIPRYWGIQHGIAIASLDVRAQSPTSILADAWLGQANYLMKRYNLLSLAEDLTVGFGITFFMETTTDFAKRNMVNSYTLDETFIGSPKSDAAKSTVLEGSPTPQVYLFLRQAFVDDKTYIHFPKFYWSDDPSGVEPQAETPYSCLDTPVITAGVRCERYKAYHYEALQQFHAACGFDPDSDEVARHLGLPIYELVDPRRADDQPNVGALNLS